MLKTPDGLENDPESWNCGMKGQEGQLATKVNADVET
jgi:hypothetical protein